LRRRGVTTQAVLWGEEADEIEPRIAHDVDGVAAVECDRGTVDHEAEPLVLEARGVAHGQLLQPHPDRNRLRFEVGLARRGTLVGKGSDHGIGDGGARLPDQLVLAARVNAVSEQDDEKLALGIEPDRGAGETGVAEGTGGEERSGGGIAHRRPGVPAEGAAGLGHARQAGELLDRPPRDDPPVLENTAVQDRLGKPRQVAGGAEQPRVWSHAAEGGGVLVVHLAL
jgi:hypothetical protein